MRMFDCVDLLLFSHLVPFSLLGEHDVVKQNEIVFSFKVSLSIHHEKKAFCLFCLLGIKISQ